LLELSKIVISLIVKLQKKDIELFVEVGLYLK